MNWIFEWIKEHPKKTIRIAILCVVFLTIGVPVIIHICFKIPAPFQFWEADWESGNVLEYYGAILGFLGTALLSALALYQNYEIKKESDAKQALIERMEYEKEMPLFRVKNLYCNGNFGNLNLSVFNVSDNVAYDLEVSSFKVENREGVCICESKMTKIKRTELVGNTETGIEFVNDSFFGKDLKIAFQIKCKDKFGKSHTYNVSSKIEDASKFSGKYRIIEL